MVPTLANFSILLFVNFLNNIIMIIISWRGTASQTSSLWQIYEANKDREA